MILPKILSYDPGGSTGWAKYDNFEEGTIPFNHGTLGPGDHHGELWHLLEDERLECERRNQPLIIVGESFQYRNGLDKAELMSCEYIGLIKLFRDWHLSIPVIWQTASMGKIREARNGKAGSFTKKRHLEKLGLWSPGPIHPMDAYGHLLYYVINGGNPIFADLRLRLLERAWK